MKAITHEVFGPPEVLQVVERELPQVSDDGILVQVYATSVTTADWRFRAAEFPAGMRLPGKLTVGFGKPRNQLTGREFSGRVIAIGRKVKRFAVGDEVFGATPGANAEVIALPESASVVHKPASLSHAEAASLPFGTITAHHFLTNLVNMMEGDRILVIGASGGVGSYVVQLAVALGADVTGVCSTANLDFVRSLGAREVIDYTTTDASSVEATYDAIIDTVGKSTFKQYRKRLAKRGKHAFIEGSGREALQALTTLFSRQKVLFGVAIDNVENFNHVVRYVEQGAIRPLIGHRFPMDQVVEAHRVVDARRRRGAVILDFPAAGVKHAPAAKEEPSATASR